MSEKDPKFAGKYNLFLQGVKLAAAPAEVQLDVLPDFCVKCDEIALDLDDSVGLIPELQRAGWVSESVADDLRKANALTDEAPGSVIWSDAAIRAHPVWDQIRLLASSALDKLGVEDRMPLRAGVVTGDDSDDA